MHSVFLLVNLIDNFVVSTMVRLDLTHSLFSFIPLSPLPLPITFTIGNCQLTDLWLDHFFTLHFIQSHISVFTFTSTFTCTRTLTYEHLYTYPHHTYHMSYRIPLAFAHLPYKIPHFIRISTWHLQH